MAKELLGRICLYSHEGFILRSDPDGVLRASNPRLLQGEEESGRWWLFSVSGSDMVSLQNQGSLKWLCGEPNGSCNCTREKLLAWEMWHMSWEGSQISLKSLHGRFLCAEWNAGRVVANRRECKEWELWRVTDTEGIPFTGTSRQEPSEAKSAECTTSTESLLPSHASSSPVVAAADVGTAAAAAAVAAMGTSQQPSLTKQASLPSHQITDTETSLLDTPRSGVSEPEYPALTGLNLVASQQEHILDVEESIRDAASEICGSLECLRVGGGSVEGFQKAEYFSTAGHIAGSSVGDRIIPGVVAAGLDSKSGTASGSIPKVVREAVEPSLSSEKTTAAASGGAVVAAAKGSVGSVGREGCVGDEGDDCDEDGYVLV